MQLHYPYYEIQHASEEELAFIWGNPSKLSAVTFLCIHCLLMFIQSAQHNLYLKSLLLIITGSSSVVKYDYWKVPYSLIKNPPVRVYWVISHQLIVSVQRLIRSHAYMKQIKDSSGWAGHEVTNPNFPSKRNFRLQF